MGEERRRALIISTVAQSLVFQSPSSWDVLRDEGYDLVFACGNDEWTTALRRWGEVRILPLSRSPGPGAIARGASALRRLLAQNWDLVQVQTPIAAALVRLVRPMRRRTHPSHAPSPLIYVVHGFHFDPTHATVRSAPARVVERLLMRRTDVVATVAADDHRWATARAHGAQVHRLPGAGVDVERFATPQPPVMEDRQPYHLICGELNANKDPLFAIEVVRALRGRGRQDHLVVIGRGPLEDQVSAAVREQDWLHWLPHSDQVERYLQSASSLLAPSWREGVPRVIIEALASGTPVLARSNRGSRELLTGLFTVMETSASAEDWARQLETELARPLDRQRLRDRADRYGEAGFVAAYRSMITSAVCDRGAGPMP